ncbi:hypothetical protein GF354_03055 [Candidatus Peregrinibacteria bacterium]|nr:hypothetical protein [Candidatus Peregrinibacteria bacterium]
MPVLSDLKSKKLKEFLANYPSYSSLSDEEKSEYLKKLVNLPLEDQDSVYEFLATENQKEKLNTLEKFSDTLTELANKLNSLKLSEKEKLAEEKDKEKLDDLLDEID